MTGKATEVKGVHDPIPLADDGKLNQFLDQRSKTVEGIRTE